MCPAIGNDELRKVKMADVNLGRVMEALQEYKRPSKKEIKEWEWRAMILIREWKLLVLSKSILYKNETSNRRGWTLVIAESMRVVMLSRLHDTMGHQGRDRTVGIIRERGYWTGMWKHIEMYVDNCKTFAIANSFPLKVKMYPISSKIPGEVLAIKFMILKKYKECIENVLVMIDVASQLGSDTTTSVVS